MPLTSDCVRLTEESEDTRGLHHTPCHPCEGRDPVSSERFCATQTVPPARGGGYWIPVSGFAGTGMTLGDCIGGCLLLDVTPGKGRKARDPGPIGNPGEGGRRSVGAAMAGP